MKLQRRKDDSSSIRRIVSDDHKTFYGLIGKTVDMDDANLISIEILVLFDSNMEWCLIYPKDGEYHVKFASSKEELLKDFE